jgi:hypothetical protein
LRSLLFDTVIIAVSIVVVVVIAIIIVIDAIPGTMLPLKKEWRKQE